MKKIITYTVSLMLLLSGLLLASCRVNEKNETLVSDSTINSNESSKMSFSDTSKTPSENFVSQPNVNSNSKKGSSLMVSSSKSIISSNSNSITPYIPPTSGTNLHITGNNHNIGDVHPYYDASSKKWYMFYLANINNSYIPKLLISSDMLHWSVVNLTREGNSPKQTYYVLGVIKHEGVYYSYYGNGGSMEGSESNNLSTWKNNPFISITNDLTKFPSTSRDPYVFYDSDTNTYKCISSAYVTNQEWKRGAGMDVSLGLSTTTGKDLTSWTDVQKQLINFPDGYKGEPECPQMFKLGSRWYLLANLARRTNNHVGPPSYWIGDSNKKIDDVSWATKSENKLEGDDLCAAQIAFDGSKYRLWGWIPKSATGGSWGGDLNLPREVYQQNDGTLGVKIDNAVSAKIRGEILTKLNPSTIDSNNELKVDGEFNRFDLEMDVSFNNSIFTIIIGGAKVSLSNNYISVQNLNGSIDFSKYVLPTGKLNGKANIRIVAESNILEIFINDKWSLCSRLDFTIDNSIIKLKSMNGNSSIETCKVFRLKFLEEV